MNSLFSSWATSSAFTLSLSRAQIRAINDMKRGGARASDQLNPYTIFSLEKRGILVRAIENPDVVGLSAAGRLIAGLLAEAGLQDEVSGPDEPRRETAMEEAIKNLWNRSQMTMPQVAARLGCNKSHAHRVLIRSTIEGSLSRTYPARPRAASPGQGGQ